MEFCDSECKLRDLTPRELEVVMYITQGLENFMIAEELRIEESTVRSYVSHVFKKAFGEDVQGPERRARRFQLGQLYKQCCNGEKAKLNVTSTKHSISDNANIVFLQALGTTLASWNEVSLEDRHRETFIGIFDALLEIIVQAPISSGDDVREEVERMRNLLEVAIRQALESLE